MFLSSYKIKSKCFVMSVFHVMDEKCVLDRISFEFFCSPVLAVAIVLLNEF